MKRVKFVYSWFRQGWSPPENEWQTFGIFHGFGVKNGNSAAIIEVQFSKSNLDKTNTNYDGKGLIELIDLVDYDVWFLED